MELPQHALSAIPESELSANKTDSAYAHRMSFYPRIRAGDFAGVGIPPFIDWRAEEIFFDGFGIRMKVLTMRETKGHAPLLNSH